jgi:hypothetical protein
MKTTRHNSVETSTDDVFLRQQAWEYFNTHASQRLTIFNFYIGLSSVAATGFFASFKSDSNLQSARPLLAALLCFISFVFWKLDQRSKVLIKNAEHVLKHFEEGQPHSTNAKVFLREESETSRHRESFRGWRKVLFWKLPLSYSRCFNLVYLVFFVIGFVGFVVAIAPYLHHFWLLVREQI